jgi:quinol monooxygenase YgiN
MVSAPKDHIETEVEMLKKIVRLSVEATIHEGAQEAFEAAAKAMTTASETEPGTLGYEWFFSADRKQCRLLETYADADAVQAHFTGPVVLELVPKIMPLCTMDRFEVYGDPGPQVTAMLGAFGARIFNYWAGLNR